MSADSQQIVAKAWNFAHVLRDVGLRLAADLARAARLRWSILERTFASRLVPQDLADEPAAKLLEWIRNGLPSANSPPPRTLRRRGTSPSDGSGAPP